jgi:hypothetical protein
MVVVVVAAGVLLAPVTGCSSVIEGRPVAPDIAVLDRQLIIDYFERNNAAADDGADAQQEFFAKTQHPDSRAGSCDLGGRTLNFEPSLSTLRPDRRWAPKDGDKPRGRVYVVAVTVTVQFDSAVLGTQIGSVHLIVLDQMTYGFAPCLA